MRRPSQSRSTGAGARFPRRFGRTPRWSLGIEEELFVVDATSLEPAAVPASVLDGSRRKPELHRTMLELTTGVCASVDDAARQLAALRRGAAADLARDGLSLLASGTHPFARSTEQEITEEPAMQRFAAFAGPAARVQYCAGLHVHVSVASPEECLEALEFVLPWLPLVLALSTNSPYFEGRETGYGSTRAELLTRLPRSGAPPEFRTFEEWEAFAGRLVDLGLADDYTRIWWDVRPHPRLGTLEVRMADQPTDLAVTAALAALVRALVATSRPGPPADRGLYAQNRFSAQRFGLGAELVHPDGSRLVSPPELAGELLELVRPGARALGDEPLLEGVGELARASQADAQLELGRARGPAALAASLARRTAGDESSSRFASLRSG